MRTKKLKPFETFNITATRSSSIMRTLTGGDLILIPILTGRAFALTISNKVIFEIFMKKYDNTKSKIKKISRL